MHSQCCAAVTAVQFQNHLVAPKGDTAPIKRPLSILALPPNLLAPADLLSASTDLPALDASQERPVQNVPLGAGFTRAGACVGTSALLTASNGLLHGRATFTRLVTH